MGGHPLQCGPLHRHVRVRYGAYALDHQLGNLPFGGSQHMQQHRHRGGWISNFVVSMTFLSIVDYFHTMTGGKDGGAFFLYAAIAALGFLLLCFFLPETGNVPLEEVSAL